LKTSVKQLLRPLTNVKRSEKPPSLKEKEITKKLVRNETDRLKKSVNLLNKLQFNVRQNKKSDRLD